MKPGSNGLNNLTGVRTIDGMSIGFSAVYLPNVKLWEIAVIDHFGEQSKATEDDVWTHLAVMVDIAIADSRERMREVEGV